MNIIKGFPPPKVGLYYFWSSFWTLPRFTKIYNDQDNNLVVDIMFQEDGFYYDQCVATMSGFDLKLGFQVNKDVTPFISHVEVKEPDFLELKEGYLIYGTSQIKEQLEKKLDRAFDGAYIEVADLLGTKVIFSMGINKPQAHNLDGESKAGFYHYKLEIK
jgi:hypothetical protein